MMHIVPTSILHSLEGMPGLDWQRLLKLQCSDGSFLFSPSATAYALMQTGDKKCFAYIDRIIKKFDGGGKRFVAFHWPMFRKSGLLQCTRCHFVAADLRSCDVENFFSSERLPGRSFWAHMGCRSVGASWDIAVLPTRDWTEHGLCQQVFHNVLFY